MIEVGDGRGFIVGAGEARYVITAAHCLPEHPRPHLANSATELTVPNFLGVIGGEQTIWCELAVDNLIDDLAVFAAPDDQELSEQCERFELFTADATALKLGQAPEVVASYLWETMPGAPAWVLSLDGEWRPCTVHNGGRFLTIDHPAQLVESGMSGSPIIDAQGAAIGVISTTGHDGSVQSECKYPRLPAAMAVAQAGGWMTNPAPTIELADGEMFVVLDGVRIAKRGRLGTVEALKWISIVPGIPVRDVGADGIEIIKDPVT